MSKSKEFCRHLLIFIVYIHLGIVSSSRSSGRDGVLLSDVKTLTLYNGKMTNSRRSAPVPQLKCVGGSAGCGAFVPQVVQCTNRGSDGYDVQWECKTDMDNAYRFGRVEVSCEGYEYPDDPYILRGSCGLEYTIDLTEEGHEKRRNQQHHNYGNQYGGNQDDYHHRSSYQSGYGYSKAKSILGDVIMLCAVGGVVYIIYRTCIAGGPQTATGYPPNQDNQWGNSQPPPPGFRQDYMPGGASCSGSSQYGGHTNYGQPGNTGGGFWTGAATGGLLGYMFGNRGNNHYGSRTYSPYTGSSFWGQSHTHRPTAFSGGSSFSSFGGGSSSRSSGTRTASGFGGTKRR
ncbi:store-operated calcium entry-associated regulatory factor-like [Argopecten irradians]|uniref:store-operated calcium entry-associated regulatory factor-like n=1 Tax=Argopecten irradians TaxID=31199 RepID=UPI0037229601